MYCWRQQLPGELWGTGGGEDGGGEEKEEEEEGGSSWNQ